MPSISEESSILEEALYEIYDTLLTFGTSGGIWLVGVTVALVALYAVHTLTVWLSGDPERAFHSAKLVVGYASTGYNTYGTLKNVAVDLQREAIPAWNAAAKHVFEPAIWTGMEVVSLVFLGHSHRGILPDSVPYEGYKCGTNPDGSEAAQFCAEANAYASELGTAEASGGNVGGNGTTLLLSTGAARRLQALSSGQSLVGVLPIQPIIDAVHDIVGVAVTVGSQMADVFWHVVYTILTELAVLIFNIVQVLIKAIAGAVMQLVQSGLLQSLLKMGIDLIMVLLFNVALPLLFAILDAIICLINFMQPGTWATQLQCSERLHALLTPPSLPPFPTFPLPRDMLTACGPLRSRANVLPGERRPRRRDLHDLLEHPGRRQADRRDGRGDAQPDDGPAVRRRGERRLGDARGRRGQHGQRGGVDVRRVLLVQGERRKIELSNPKALPATQTLEGHACYGSAVPASSATPLSPPCRQVPELRAIWLLVSNAYSNHELHTRTLQQLQYPTARSVYPPGGRSR